LAFGNPDAERGLLAREHQPLAASY
jgi:hypothetical protein